jgi:hypothetical protein
MANSFLSRTPGSTTDAQRKQFTISMWVKRSAPLGSGGGHQEIVSTNATDQFGFRFDGNNCLDIFDYSVSGNSYPLRLTTNRKFRDTNAFYNIVLQVDTPNATSSNRAKLWINGVQETSFSTATYPSQDYVTTWNKNGLHQIGSKAWGNSGNGSDFFSGYISHLSNVAGSVVAPTVFGETDSTSGIWKFKSPSATWGANGFHLKFENAASLGTDSSGNSNNFTVNGNLKQSINTPSNIYNTFNPRDFGDSGGTNVCTAETGSTYITSTTSNAWRGIHGHFGINSGKWYYEVKVSGSDADTGYVVGWCDFAYNTDDNPNSGSPNAKMYGRQNTYLYHASGFTASFFPAVSSGDILMFAFDMDNGKLWMGQNGTWHNTNGSSGNTSYSSTTLNPSYPDVTGITVSSRVGYYTPSCQIYNDGFAEFNFGEGRFNLTAISSAGSNGNGSSFEYDVPSGFYALNTKNLNTYG